MYYVVEKSGEVTECAEVDVFNTCVFADMVIIPLKNAVEILEETEDGFSNVFVQGI